MKLRTTLVLALAALLLAPLAMAGQAETAYQMQVMMDDANDALAAAGADVRIGYAEWITVTGETGEMGATVFYKNVGNKQLSSEWVPNDPRRVTSVADGLTYLVDSSDGATASGLSNAQTEAAIDSAMATWDFDTNCSDLPIVKNADPGVDPDLIDALLGFGPPPGPGYPHADIVHAGWTNAFAPPTLGVTFTLIWTVGGVPTDIDNNGKTDTAVREIFYNNLYNWQLGANIDVETVALHEAGHGLSQGHFGSLSQTPNGKYHFSPLAVMNAGYTQVQQDLKATDTAGHCSLYGSWPNN